MAGAAMPQRSVSSVTDVARHVQESLVRGMKSMEPVRVALAFFVALSVSSAHAQTQQHLIERYYRDAQIAFQQGNARHARDLLAKILELRNDIPEVHNLL